MNEHNVILTYRNDDDGVWLECSCRDWEKNLGFFPTVLDAVNGEMEHLEKVDPQIKELI